MERKNSDGSGQTRALELESLVGSPAAKLLGFVANVLVVVLTAIGGIVGTKVLDLDLRLTRIETTHIPKGDVMAEFSKRDERLWDSATRDDIDALKERLESLAYEVRELRSRLDAPDASAHDAQTSPYFKHIDLPMHPVFTALLEHIE